ncbi:MAG: restriction endonuclease [Candidatus Acidiferrales bacterium]
MPVPDYQSLMAPILKIASDAKEHTKSQTVEEIACQLKLTDEERKELLPSGRQAKFDNRLGWATTYLKKAGLLESTGRGRFRITQRGLEVLENNADDVNTDFLKKFPEFQEFRSLTREEAPEEQQISAAQTPEETLEFSYQKLKQDLIGEVLSRLKKCSLKFFEQLVVDLLLAMGYGGSRKDAGRAVGQSGDGGVDGIIKEDKLGLDVVYVQAKRWEANVGRPVVQGFAGSLEGFRAKKGVLITTSQFSDEARDYATRIEKKIVLVDGEHLAQLMVDHGIGVTEVASYTVKRIDLDYFGEE